MVETSYVDLIAKEKASAKEILKLHSAHMPVDPIEAADVYVQLPIVKIAELSLQHIQEHGGKVQASLIAELSAADKLEEIQADLAYASEKRAGNPLEKTSRHVNNAQILGTLADEMMQHGLVELPVVSRGRGRG